MTTFKDLKTLRDIEVRINDKYDDYGIVNVELLRDEVRKYLPFVSSSVQLWVTAFFNLEDQS